MAKEYCFDESLLWRVQKEIEYFAILRGMSHGTCVVTAQIFIRELEETFSGVISVLPIYASLSILPLKATYGGRGEVIESALRKV